MSSRHNKNEICTKEMWNVITSTEMFKFIVSIKRISSMSNLKEMILFLFKINVVLLILCKVVNCSISSDEKSVASWSINIFLNSGLSYLDAVKTLKMYDIEFAETMMLFIEISLCLNVLSTSMIMIADCVFESSIESTAIKNHFDLLSSLMTNSLIKILSNEISMSMFNFSKNWAIKSSSWLSLNSLINCFKRCSNLWRDFHMRLRFAKRFLK
jgi:membrane-associated HD superfamily phosphohydrolase